LEFVLGLEDDHSIERARRRACLSAASRRPWTHEPPADASLSVAFHLAAVARAYAALAEQYAEDFGDELQRVEFDRQVLARLVARCKPGGLVLDAGCGPGQVSAFVDGVGRFAVALDLTFEMLVIARRVRATSRLLRADVVRMPFASASFDGAACWYSIHNMPRALLPSALRELRRVIHPGGALVLATHAGSGEEWRDVAADDHGEQVVLTYYSPDEIRGLVVDAGFGAVDIRTRAPLPEEHQVDKIYVFATSD
jgi:ubiquinone/menaquinone biosynthesis C-methylase UbiE